MPQPSPRAGDNDQSDHKRCSQVPTRSEAAECSALEQRGQHLPLWTQHSSLHAHSHAGKPWRAAPLPVARCPLPAPSPTRWRRRPGSRRPQPRALPCGVTDAGAAAGSRRSLRRQNVQKADVVLVSPRPAPSLPHTEVPAVPWVPPVTGNHRVPHPKLSAQQLPSHSARENEHN